jgi:hypothetical protein
MERREQGTRKTGTGRGTAKCPGGSTRFRRQHKKADCEQRAQRKDRKARDYRADNGVDLAAVQEKADDAQDERQGRQTDERKPSKGLDRGTSTRLPDSQRSNNYPRHNRKDEADLAEDSPSRPGPRGMCSRVANGSDIACRHGAAPLPVR